MDFLNFWQHIPFRISPYLFEIGSFQLRYYSLMYLVAFGLTYILVIYRIGREKYDITAETVQDFFLWAILGLILGARLGYVLLYNPVYYLKTPWEVFLPFEFSGGMRFVGISGMSYHGGAIGVAIGTVLFCRKHRVDFWRFADLICPAIPLGYTFGRIGNFINGELWGRVTDVPWGMIFPFDPTQSLRHPSQLYEAFFEGVVLFVLLWVIRRKSPFDGFLLAVYITGYGLVRFIIEFFREPDAQLGLVLGFLSMGQLLCILMMMAGTAIFVLRKQAAMGMKDSGSRKKRRKL